jgi:hypothetical protein
VHLRVTNPLIFDFQRKRKNGRREVIVRAIANGHDGVLMRNHYDAGGVSDQWVVFSPSQIKSIFNTGAYDPTNPDIRSAAWKMRRRWPTLPTDYARGDTSHEHVTIHRRPDLADRSERCNAFYPRRR